MALTDIICEDNSDVVQLLCKRMDVLGSDLVLDSPARRKPNGPFFRRALVHDESDGLTVNFNRDYPGGVTVHGPLGVSGGFSFEMQELGHTGQIPPPGGGGGQVLIRTQVDLGVEISALRARIAVLEAKIGG